MTCLRIQQNVPKIHHRLTLLNAILILTAILFIKVTMDSDPSDGAFPKCIAHARLRYYYNSKWVGEMAARCRKFVPNLFNKSKCQSCFGAKESHSAEALESSKVRSPDNSFCLNS